MANCIYDIDSGDVKMVDIAVLDGTGGRMAADETPPCLEVWYARAKHSADAGYLLPGSIQN